VNCENNDTLTFNLQFGNIAYVHFAPNVTSKGNGAMRIYSGFTLIHPQPKATKLRLCSPFYQEEASRGGILQTHWYQIHTKIGLNSFHTEHTKKCMTILCNIPCLLSFQKHTLGLVATTEWSS